MFESRRKSDTEGCVVRQRKTKAKKGLVVAKATHQDDQGWRLRLWLVSVAALAAISCIVRQDCGGGHRASAQDCADMKEMDNIARSLGLDCLPGYTEACFSLGERLRIAVQPITGTAADFLHEVARRLHRIRRRLVRVINMTHKVVSKTLTSIFWREVRGLTKMYRLASKVMTPALRRVVRIVTKVYCIASPIWGVVRIMIKISRTPSTVRQVVQMITTLCRMARNPAEFTAKFQEVVQEITKIHRNISKTVHSVFGRVMRCVTHDNEPPEVGRADEGDTAVPEESQPARDEGEEEALVLTRKDLKAFAMKLAEILGKEMDEGSADDLVNTVASRKSS